MLFVVECFCRCQRLCMRESYCISAINCPLISSDHLGATYACTHYDQSGAAPTCFIIIAIITITIIIDIIIIIIISIII